MRRYLHPIRSCEPAGQENEKYGRKSPLHGYYEEKKWSGRLDLNRLKSPDRAWTRRRRISEISVQMLAIKRFRRTHRGRHGTHRGYFGKLAVWPIRPRASLAHKDEIPHPALVRRSHLLASRLYVVSACRPTALDIPAQGRTSLLAVVTNRHASAPFAHATGKVFPGDRH